MLFRTKLLNLLLTMFFKYSKVTSDICGLIKNGYHAQYPKDMFKTKIPVSSSSQVTVPVEYLAQTGA